MKKNNMDHIIARLILAAAVYFLWHERNNRVFKSFAQTHHMTAEAIFQQLRTHIANMGTADTIPMQTLVSWQLHED